MLRINKNNLSLPSSAAVRENDFSHKSFSSKKEERGKMNELLTSTDDDDDEERPAETQIFLCCLNERRIVNKFDGVWREETQDVR